MTRYNHIFFILNFLIIIFILSYTFKYSINANIDANDFREISNTKSYPVVDSKFLNYGIIKNYQIKLNFDDNNDNNILIEISGGSFQRNKIGNWSYSDTYKNFHSSKLFNYFQDPVNKFNVNSKKNSSNFSINHISTFDDQDFIVTLFYDPNKITFSNFYIEFSDLDNNKIITPFKKEFNNDSISYYFDLNFMPISNYYFIFIFFIIFSPISFIFAFYRFVERLSI
tara:strand:+ start:192 stop:869 length:678 start_codon:yes stop_codon:yes gene_type:complete